MKMLQIRRSFRKAFNLKDDAATSAFFDEETERIKKSLGIFEQTNSL